MAPPDRRDLRLAAARLCADDESRPPFRGNAGGQSRRRHAVSSTAATPAISTAATAASGHLFQGRFRGHLIEEEGYFLEVSRYIHLNPVRAKLVERPEQWPWSSYPGYHSQRQAVDWITYASVLGEFGPGNAGRRGYARFVHAAMDQPPWSPFADAAGGLLLGSSDFVDRMRKLLDERPPDKAMPQLTALRPRPSLAKIAAVVAAHFGDDQSCWTNGRRSDDAGRAVAACLGRRFGYAATEVAQALGYRSHGSVRNALARVEAGGQVLRDLVAKLYRKLH